jgi:hypothetical protein
MECLPSGLMIRDNLLCFVLAKCFSLSGRQAWIGAFLVVDHFPCAFALDPAGFSMAFATRRMLTGGCFSPPFFVGFTGEPNRAAQRCSQRL